MDQRDYDQPLLQELNNQAQGFVEGLENTFSNKPGIYGPQVGVHVEVDDNGTKTVVAINPKETEGTVNLSNERFYLASVLKPLMAVAIARMIESANPETNLSRLYSLFHKVIYVSNDADLASLRAKGGNVTHNHLSSDSLKTNTPLQTISELTQSILNSMLDKSFKRESLHIDNLPDIFLNRSQLSENPTVLLPNSAVSYQKLLEIYDIFWDIVDQNREEPLFKSARNALSRPFSEEENIGKSHDLRTFIYRYLGENIEEAWTKSGNNTNYGFIDENGVWHQSINDNRFTPGAFIDVYNCVSRVELVDGRVIKISYICAVPFHSKNDAATSAIIRARLNEQLDKFIQGIEGVIIG